MKVVIHAKRDLEGWYFAPKNNLNHQQVLIYCSGKEKHLENFSQIERIKKFSIHSASPCHRKYLSCTPAKNNYPRLITGTSPSLLEEHYSFFRWRFREQGIEQPAQNSNITSRVSFSFKKIFFLFRKNYCFYFLRTQARGKTHTHYIWTLETKFQHRFQFSSLLHSV